jgi:hypothetical protein
MTPEPIAAMTPEQRGMGEFSRLTGVLLEPSTAFEDIARRPTWLVPLLLVIVAGIAYFTTFGQHVGWQRFLQHQMDTNPKAAARMAQVPPEQRARQMEIAVKITGISYPLGVAVVTPLVLLISSAIVLGILSAMSAGVRFKQVFSITTYASLPVILKHALAIVVMFLKNPDDFNLVNPLAFNPAAFMDPVNGSKFLYTIGTAVDLFNIWTILLTATGLKIAAGKRLTFGQALFAVVTPWAVFTLAGAGFAAAFS